MAFTSFRGWQYYGRYKIFYFHFIFTLWLGSRDRPRQTGVKRWNVLVLHVMNRFCIYCMEPRQDYDNLVSLELPPPSPSPAQPSPAQPSPTCYLTAWLHCVKASRHQLSTACSILIVCSLATTLPVRASYSSKIIIHLSSSHTSPPPPSSSLLPLSVRGGGTY